jgi:hypothetical protein
VSTGFDGVATTGATPWAVEHPGAAALASALATYAVAIGVGIALPVSAAAGGRVWPGVLVLVGALLFVAGLPAALGFAGACCATQRELVAGVLAGFLVVLLALVSVALVAPAHGLV